MTIQELLKIAGEQGKVVIVGEDGQVQGVYLNYEEYQKLRGTEPNDSRKQNLAYNEEVEKINREILQAQLEEVMAPQPQADNDEYIDPAVAEAITQLLDQSNNMVAEAVDQVRAVERQVQPKPKSASAVNSLNALLNQRAETLFGNYPGPSAPAPKVEISPSDLRAEVMDPNFDYGDDGSDELNDDETIKPNFDEI